MLQQASLDCQNFVAQIRRNIFHYLVSAAAIEQMVPVSAIRSLGAASVEPCIGSDHSRTTTHGISEDVESVAGTTTTPRLIQRRAATTLERSVANCAFKFGAVSVDAAASASPIA